MLFYVQMRWNYQGRISLDELWDLEGEEAKAAVESIELGIVKHHSPIVEKVWALRDYIGFAADVWKHYKFDG